MILLKFILTTYSDFIIKKGYFLLSKNDKMNKLYIEDWIINLWDWADKNNIPEDLIPRDKEDLLQLERLNFHNYSINMVPKEIGYLTNLIFLHITKKNIQCIPEEIGNLTNLKYLYLHENNLISLPESIRRLANLNTLTLNNNDNLVLSNQQKEWIKNHFM